MKDALQETYNGAVYKRTLEKWKDRHLQQSFVKFLKNFITMLFRKPKIFYIHLLSCNFRQYFEGWGETFAVIWYMTLEKLLKFINMKMRVNHFSAFSTQQASHNVFWNSPYISQYAAANKNANNYSYPVKAQNSNNIAANGGTSWMQAHIFTATYLRHFIL